jgi:hypothetical protein
LFPMRARAAAMSLSLAAQFLCNTLVGERLGGGRGKGEMVGWGFGAS